MPRRGKPAWPSFPRTYLAWKIRAALERVGFIFRRQTGSHMVLRRDQPYARVIVPDHKRIRSGTLRRIISDAGLTVDQFMQLLGR